MKADRILVAVNALVAIGLGFGLAARGEPLPGVPEWSGLATLRLVGIGMAGLGIAFALLADPGTDRDRRRVAGLLAVADATLAGVAAWLQATAWQGSRGWLWVAIFGSLGMSLAWLAVRPQMIRLARGMLGANAAALFVVGTGPTILGSPFLPQTGRGSAADYSASVGILGVGLGAFGLVLLGLLSLQPWRARARLALGLAAGNAASAAIAAGQQIAIWTLPLTRSLVFLFVALAVAALWIGLALFQNPQDSGRPSSSTLVPWLVGSHLAIASAAVLGLLYLPRSTGIGVTLGVAAAGGLAIAFLLQRQVAWAEAALLNLVEGEPAPKRPRALTGALAGLASAIQTLTPNVQGAGDVRRGWMHRLGEAAAQEERNRLARDLHDSIKQQLFSINVGVAAAQARWDGDPEGARAAVADVRQSAQAAMAEMKALLLQLRPEALAGVGLVEALREQCEALQYRAGAEVTCAIGDPIPDAELPPGAQEAIFRVAQEALSNVARHARARKVRLSLRREDGWAVLVVEDDGQGFDVEGVRSGMGLSNMRERASGVSGTLEVESTPGRLTRVTLRVPFTKKVELTPVPLEQALRTETLLTAFALLAGIPILLDLWGLTPMTPLLVWTGPSLLLFVSGRQLLGLSRRHDLPKTLSEIRLRHAALRTRRAFALELIWWAIWNLESRQGEIATHWSFFVMCFAFGVSHLSSAANEAARTSAWRSLVKPGGSYGFLVGAAALALLPLSMVALAPAQGILLWLAVVVELYLFAREPRLPEATP
jgi:signal transduction histidine kinase